MKNLLPVLLPATLLCLCLLATGCATEEPVEIENGLEVEEIGGGLGDDLSLESDEVRGAPGDRRLEQVLPPGLAGKIPTYRSSTLVEFGAARAVFETPDRPEIVRPAVERQLRAVGWGPGASGRWSYRGWQLVLTTDPAGRGTRIVFEFSSGTGAAG